MSKVLNCIDRTNPLSKKHICPVFETKFYYLRNHENPNYLNGLKPIPRLSKTFKKKHRAKRKPRGLSSSLSCIEGHNVTCVNPTNIPDETDIVCKSIIDKLWLAQYEPKYLTTLRKVTRNIITGEISEDVEIVVGDIYKRLKRRNRSIKAFADHFAPLYARYKVSMFFFTLTIADHTGVDIRNILDILKKRGKAQKPDSCPIIGYHWVLELASDNHIHYHACVVTNRMNIVGKRMPKWLKLDNVWGARTQVVFVEKDVHQYLSNYLNKGFIPIVGKRMYGKSITKIKSKKR